MSFLFGGGRPQLTSEQKIANAESEVDMITDMFTRLSQSCSKKCIPADYREPDLNKAESVCLDRCVSKFFEANMKVSEQMQAQAAGKQASGGGMFGM